MTVTWWAVAVTFRDGVEGTYRVRAADAAEARRKVQALTLDSAAMVSATPRRLGAA